MLTREPVVAWTAFGTGTLNNEWSWRIPAFLQSIPSIIQLLGIYCKFCFLI